jgi:RNA polymerase sigma factor (TIGR02999 family)
MNDETSPANEVTERLRRWSDDPEGDAADGLLELVYAELHRQARRYLQRERVGHTLQTTALVHEAYLKLAEQKDVKWESRNHFFAIAATSMRRILVDHARHKHREKRGGKANDLSLGQALTVAVGGVDIDLLALDEALERLAEKEEYLARVVELRFFSGLDVAQTAGVLGVSESTVKRDWAMARAWLRREMEG